MLAPWYASPQPPGLRRDCDSQRVFQRLQRTHGVSVRADRADAETIWVTSPWPVADEAFEEANALEDVEVDLADFIPFENDGDAAVSFHSSK